MTERPAISYLLLVLWCLGFWAAAFPWVPELLRPLFALTAPLCLMMALRPRISLWLVFLTHLIALAGLYHWTPSFLEVFGNLPKPGAWAAGMGIAFLDALALTLMSLLAQWFERRQSALGMAWGAAVGILLMEVAFPRIYVWSWGAFLAGWPLLAKASAFLGTHGLSTLLWGFAGLGAGFWPKTKQVSIAWVIPVFLFSLLGSAWSFLPRREAQSLDVLLVQPNHPVGRWWPEMEIMVWSQTDEALRKYQLPDPQRPCLVLWPESAVLHRDDARPNPRLALEAQRRGIAWIYGTEGTPPGGRSGAWNLARGEWGGQAPLLLTKVLLVPFAERVPGPSSFRNWVETQFQAGYLEPGQMDARSSLQIQGVKAPLRIHPLICFEATSSLRAQAGVEAAGAELLANLTNDGWFGSSIATYLHGDQVRLRAAEMGVPLLRCTLTGVSALFKEDGRAEWLGRPMEAGTWARRLEWQPIQTPARTPWPFRILLALLAISLAFLLFRRGSSFLSPRQEP